MPNEIISTLLGVAKKVGESEEFKTFVCGTYSDGTTRSLSDAMNNQVLSPKQKQKQLKKEQEKKAKKKKKKKETKLRI